MHIYHTSKWLPKTTSSICAYDYHIIYLYQWDEGSFRIHIYFLRQNFQISFANYNRRYKENGLWMRSTCNCWDPQIIICTLMNVSFFNRLYIHRLRYPPLHEWLLTDQESLLLDYHFAMKASLTTVPVPTKQYRTYTDKSNRYAINCWYAWWRHQMEIFSALLALCAGNSPVPVNSPHKVQWRGALMFSLICARMNNWVNNREACDLRRHRGHYDAIVMTK